MSFGKYGFSSILQQALKKIHWVEPTSIQAKTFGPALERKDILGHAPTGSGKTGAFILPLLQQISDTIEWGGSTLPMYGLIITPTRVLANQIAKVIEDLSDGLDISVVTLIGEDDFIEQGLKLGKCPHIIVATPGRLMEHIRDTHGFSLSRIHYFVLDEADRMLSLDFQLDLENIIKLLPRDRQTMLFSATLKKEVMDLKKMALTDAVTLTVKESATERSLASSTTIPANLSQKVIYCSQKYKNIYIYSLLKSELEGKSTIIFCNLKSRVDRLYHILNFLKIDCVRIHGGISERDKNRALSRFQSQSSLILIATDMLARGIDVSCLDCVVNYDLTMDLKTHTHRIGRTARAGKPGVAYTFVGVDKKSEEAVDGFSELEEFRHMEKEMTSKMGADPIEEVQMNDKEVLKEKEKVGKAIEYASFMIQKEKKKKKNLKKGHIMEETIREECKERTHLLMLVKRMQRGAMMQQQKEQLSQQPKESVHSSSASTSSSSSSSSSSSAYYRMKQRGRGRISKRTYSEHTLCSHK
ncbi:ATP-dependent rRNA helicase rrp3 [Aduncisulcus paluster]|uniref:ATP-dependent rRNA helicase rrp3 n=1 Tax=Aduncisulcus paluster TaxID=2918883 RepID=A0ABQ5KP84_9EUKA|nr:ATP-dependent rRNA helicase rrp3 [Aduncisulcus paluster]